MAKRGTSFRLSEEGIAAINDMSSMLGISQADVVEMSVRIARRAIERETGEDDAGEARAAPVPTAALREWGEK